MPTAREQSAHLAALLRDEHSALADFLVELAEFDRRRAWLALGYTSLFVFLHRELRLSKGAAQYRKTAAELVQRVPDVVEPIRDGRLCLTVVVELARVLTPENRSDVLPRFFHLSRQEAMEVVAELAPRPSPPLRQVTTTVRASPPESFASAATPCPPAPAISAQPAESSRSAGRPPRCQVAGREQRYVAAARARALGRGARHRRPAPAPRHRAAPPPREDRRGARRALARDAERDGRRRSSKRASTSSSRSTRSGRASSLGRGRCRPRPRAMPSPPT